MRNKVLAKKLTEIVVIMLFKKPKIISFPVLSPNGRYFVVG